MYLEHINLVVSHLPRALTFYQAAFPHWKIRCSGSDSWNGRARNWLHFGDDNQYIALSDHGTDPARDLSGYQIGLAHFGYVVNNLASLINRMNAAGFNADMGSNTHPYRKNAYFIDPDGFEVEFIEYSSDLPAERNSD
ncbi:glyoxalase [Pseudoalteromonas citrea]|uniref:Glyoxalase n=1 Tax=Pseudoalteromonas citrea TaxID=43655 RepID=A0A5S3XKH7_9GAMM|nr:MULTISPECIES: VOC family protein [Pseudoalteromonas]RJE73582.1 glyoxalase [Pseudoalteromonas sp. MSK9-3]TMP39137.1 glyoxalase [Pseudoalteromonas citrea]TMP53608.1 glyoxalase [Pseudoalteromonas citrea]